MRSPFLTICMLTASCSSVFGDKDPHAPGESIGQYALRADVDATSSCVEAAAAAPRPWSFEVGLRREGRSAYWINGGEPLVGALDERGGVSFHASRKVPMHPADKRREVGACVIVRTDDFSGAFVGPVDSPAGAAKLKGTLKYAYSIDAGSDCRAVVGAGLGDGRPVMFRTLPCELRFAVTATRTGEAKTPR